MLYLFKVYFMYFTKYFCNLFSYISLDLWKVSSEQTSLFFWQKSMRRAVQGRARRGRGMRNAICANKKGKMECEQKNEGQTKLWICKEMTAQTCDCLPDCLCVCVCVWQQQLQQKREWKWKWKGAGAGSGAVSLSFSQRCRQPQREAATAATCQCKMCVHVTAFVCVSVYVCVCLSEFRLSTCLSVKTNKLIWRQWAKVGEQRVKQAKGNNQGK